MNKTVASKCQRYFHSNVFAKLSRITTTTTTTSRSTTPHNSWFTFRRYNSTSKQCKPTTRTQQGYQYQQAIPPTRPLDVARFGLLSIATLPFSLWIALYSYNYYNRVDHCRVSLGEGDADWEISNKFSRRNKKYQKRRMGQNSSI